jgi:hypothetical protein
MAWAAVITGGATLLGGMMSSGSQQQAGQQASGDQSAAALAGIAEQRRQFDSVRSLLDPYVTGGNDALSLQRGLTGLNGAENQDAAVRSIQNSPQFKAMLDQGETSILQNASATGGLRGGNTQGALAQFSPMLLAQLIDSQYAKLGGLTSVGQNAAAGVGNAGMQTGSQVAALLQQQGAAQAGGALANGRAQSGMINSIAGGVGQFAGMGGFGSSGYNHAAADPTYGAGALYPDTATMQTYF